MLSFATFVENLAVALSAAFVGAAAGSLGAWAAARVRDRVRDHQVADREVQENLHQIEVRIVKLETEFAFYAALATKRLEGVGGAQQD